MELLHPDKNLWEKHTPTFILNDDCLNPHSSTNIKNKIRMFSFFFFKVNLLGNIA